MIYNMYWDYEIPDIKLSDNGIFLNPLPYTESENIRLAKLIQKNCFYFYIYYPIPTSASKADSYDVSDPIKNGMPPGPPVLRRTPDRASYHITCPHYVMEHEDKILCRAVPCYEPSTSIQCYSVYYLKEHAPPEAILFQDVPSKWLSCKWKLYANGDIYYNVQSGLYGPCRGYHYTNYLHIDHSITRAVLPQLCYAVIKLVRILYRVRMRIRIRLFIQNTHYTSSSILHKLSGSHWTHEKMLIYQYIKPSSNSSSSPKKPIIITNMNRKHNSIWF